MPIYTRDDFPQDSLHHYLFANQAGLEDGITEYLEITTDESGKTTYKTWNEPNEQLLPEDTSAEQDIIFSSMAQEIEVWKYTQEHAFVFVLKAQLNEAQAHDDEEQQLNLNDVFDYNPETKALKVKDRYSRDHAKFVKEVTALDKRPWYQRFFDSLASFVANVPQYIIAIKDAIVWVCKWLGNKMFGSAQPVDPTNAKDQEQQKELESQRVQVPVLNLLSLQITTPTESASRQSEVDSPSSTRRCSASDGDITPLTPPIQPAREHRKQRDCCAQGSRPPSPCSR